MLDISINYLAVIVATIVIIVLGAVWYMPAVFGKHWMELAGLSQTAPKQSMLRSYAVTAGTTLLMVYVMAHIIEFAGANSATTGSQTAFWVWLGFVATTSAINYNFEQRPWPLYWLVNAHHLVTFIVAGIILAVWQ